MSKKGRLSDGCVTMKCSDYKDGFCHYDSEFCKYNEAEARIKELEAENKQYKLIEDELESSKLKNRELMGKLAKAEEEIGNLAVHAQAALVYRKQGNDFGAYKEMQIVVQKAQEYLSKEK